ncbi:hypothetical protein BCR42DRAFT_236913 [Absidia repens]|uniref:Uncharacterized protein n=1 Tax=Absidia repens TaxID=90262 RepID=A0A1X2H949_9FUNG|nr:hypothetical protein BCR42DRAFT_236913 [Absidia repens]
MLLFGVDCCKKKIEGLPLHPPKKTTTGFPFLYPPFILFAHELRENQFKFRRSELFIFPIFPIFLFSFLFFPSSFNLFEIMVI